MTSILSRLTKTLSANINDMIDRIEDPERMVRQNIRDIEAGIVKVSEAVNESLIHEKQIEKEIKTYQERISAMEPDIERAVLNDNDPLAKVLLKEKNELKLMEQNFQIALTEAQHASLELKSKLSALEQELVDVRVRRSELVARQRASEAKEHIAMTSAFLRKGMDHHDNLSRLEALVNDTEARTESITSLKNFTTDDQNDEAYRVLSEAKIEAELAELKKKLVPPSD